MKKSEIKMLIKMMTNLNEIYSDSSCNDFEITNNSENVDLIKALFKWRGDGEEKMEEDVNYNWEKKRKVFFFDTEVSEYLIDCLKKELQNKEK